MQQHFTRDSNDYYVLHANIELYIESFLYNGPYFWNTLPDSLKVLPELRSFKYSCKRFLKTG